MLVDAPFAPILREWQWSNPSATTALFWLLALVGAALLAFRRCRSRLTVYELAVLAVTFVGAVQAVRGVIWFALARAAILPVALDGVLTKADVDAPQGQPRRSRSRRSRGGRRDRRVPRALRRRGTSPTGPSSRSRPSARRRATRSTRVWATDGTADWLLWRIPEFRGRIAYDVRFELYDKPTSARSSVTARAGATGRRRGWLPRVVVDDLAAIYEALAAEPGAKCVFHDDGIAVVERHPANDAPCPATTDTVGVLGSDARLDLRDHLLRAASHEDALRFLRERLVAREADLPRRGRLLGSADTVARDGHGDPQPVRASPGMGCRWPVADRIGRQLRGSALGSEHT